MTENPYMDDALHGEAENCIDLDAVGEPLLTITVTGSRCTHGMLGNLGASTLTSAPMSPMEARALLQCLAHALMNEDMMMFTAEGRPIDPETGEEMTS